MRQSFSPWQPTPPVCDWGDWDIAAVVIDRGELRLTLVPDGPLRSSAWRQRQLCWRWSDVISYRVTDESYRADCWQLAFVQDGRFYRSERSQELLLLREKSPLVPAEAVHYLLVGTNTVLDVFAQAEPSLRAGE